MGGKCVGKDTLEVLSLGGKHTSYDSRFYSKDLVTADQGVANVTAFAILEITGSVVQLDMTVIRELFPDRKDFQALQRQAGKVELMLGIDYFGLQPMTELSRARNDLSILQGPFGKCLQGFHPKLAEQTVWISNLAKAAKDKPQRFIIGGVQHNNQPKVRWL